MFVTRDTSFSCYTHVRSFIYHLQTDSEGNCTRNPNEQYSLKCHVPIPLHASSTIAEPLYRSSLSAREGKAHACQTLCFNILSTDPRSNVPAIHTIYTRSTEALDTLTATRSNRYSSSFVQCLLDNTQNAKLHGNRSGRIRADCSSRALPALSLVRWLWVTGTLSI